MSVDGNPGAAWLQVPAYKVRAACHSGLVSVLVAFVTNLVQAMVIAQSACRTERGLKSVVAWQDAASTGATSACHGCCCACLMCGETCICVLHTYIKVLAWSLLQNRPNGLDYSKC